MTADDVRRAIERAERHGSTTLLQDIERLEPDLTEYLLEELTSVHHELYQARIARRQLTRATRRLRQMLVVLVLAMRQSQDTLDEPA